MLTRGGFGQPDGPARCTAMSKRTREQCKGPAIAGDPSGKCYFHGGGNKPVGADNANFSTGRHSKYLPSDLDRLYLDALHNPQLIEMGDHIALLEARMQQVLALAVAGEPAPKWADVAETFGRMETALLSGNVKEVIPALESLHRVLENGMKWDTTWNQVIGIMEQLRKMTDTEVKRRKELNQFVPVERVVALMAALGTAVKRHVTDPEQIAAVYRELAILHGEDHAPGNTSIKKVGPDVIDISPERRGPKGGRSTHALRRRAKARLAEAGE